MASLSLAACRTRAVLGALYLRATPPPRPLAARRALATLADVRPWLLAAFTLSA
jgi:hypothetical protein